MLHLLFSGYGFVPRRFCGAWTQPLLILNMGSDLVIWASYLLIAMILFRVVRLWQQNRINVEPARHMSPVLGLVFAAFILLCGGTHLNQVVVFFWPYYRFIGSFSAITACVSLLAVMTLWQAMVLSTLPKQKPGAA